MPGGNSLRDMLWFWASRKSNPAGRKGIKGKIRCIRISHFVENRGKDAKLVITSSQISFADSKTISLRGTNKVHLEYGSLVSCVGNTLKVFSVWNKLLFFF
jgi:hypothetical protein